MRNVCSCSRDLIQKPRLLQPVILTPEALEWVFTIADEIPMFVDTVSEFKANKVKNWYSRIHTLKPTQNELEILWGQPIKDDNDRIRAVNSLHQQGVKRIFVYLKDESVFCSDKDGEQFLLTAPAHTTVDSFGADDGFMAGLTRMMAQNIVAWRDENGQFQNRQQLLKVSRLGPKAFEQCAGFLRINHGDNPLDASTVHPEAYPVVERILAATQQALKDLMGNSSELRNLKASDFTDEKFGVPTVTDIIKELEKPGRDPRPEFKTAQFADGVETMNDLQPGMILEGAVTNVTNFGAFVDIGVHQDGDW